MQKLFFDFYLLNNHKYQSHHHIYFVHKIYDAKEINTKFLPKDYLLQDEIVTWVSEFIIKAETLTAKSNVIVKDKQELFDFLTKVTQVVVIRDIYTQYAHMFGLSDEMVVNTEAELFDIYHLIDQITLAESTIHLSDVIKLLDKLMNSVSTSMITTTVLDEMIVKAFNLIELPKRTDIINLRNHQD